ncbi:hypothetical protein OE88DRAFT_1739155 [Heliocybe sulcata]|uniref:Uncharacterized protein n=1 Tax=Heliocybe sulcata TaxID=5364 RepID=A0A5C3MR17_9AGAM|nr:hypothetical protein OE88DRAFT_1739155 [Heliocybe sulcata]
MSVNPDSLIDALWTPGDVQAVWDLGSSLYSDDSEQPIQQQRELTAHDVTYMLATAGQSTAEAHTEAQNMRDTLRRLKDILSREAEEEDIAPSDPEDVVSMLQNLISRKSGQLSRFRQNKKLCGKLQLKCEVLEEELSRLRSWKSYKSFPVVHSDVPPCKSLVVRKPEFHGPLRAKRSKYSIPSMSLAEVPKYTVPRPSPEKSARTSHKSNHDKGKLLLESHPKLFIRVPPLRRPPTPRLRRKTTIIAVPEEDEGPENASTSESLPSRSTPPEPAQFNESKGKTTYMTLQTPLFEPPSSEIGSPVSPGWRQAPSSPAVVDGSIDTRERWFSDEEYVQAVPVFGDDLLSPDCMVCGDGSL